MYRVGGVLALALGIWACSSNGLEKSGDVVIDLGNQLRDAGTMLRDAGSNDAVAQETPCNWEIQVFSVANPDTSIGQTFQLPDGWEPFAVQEEPDFDKVYMRRCAS